VSRFFAKRRGVYMKARIAELTFEMKDINVQKTIDFIKFCGFDLCGWFLAYSEDDSTDERFGRFLLRTAFFLIRK
jgi:hypothetical protein